MLHLVSQVFGYILRYTIFCLLLVFTITSCSTSKQVNKAIKSKDPQLQYQLAETLFKDKKYSYADKLYENVLPYYRNDKTYSTILYKYGLCAYFQEDYSTSIVVFNNLRDNVPNFPYKEETSYYIVKAYNALSEPSYLDQDNTNATINEASQFISLYPQSIYVDSCLEIIQQSRKTLETKQLDAAKMYLKMGYLKAAVIGFQALILNFPETDQLDYYNYLLISASDKLLKFTVKEKIKERKVTLLASISNFIDQFPDSKYYPKVEALQNGILK